MTIRNYFTFQIHTWSH